jgi:hypothetical protein
MALLKSIELTLFADYYQFYLQDEPVDEDWSGSWNQEATDRMLAVARGVVAIGTARNFYVPVRVELHGEEPELDLENWDHAVECELRVDSGRIVVAGITEDPDEAAHVPVSPGVYRVRVSYGSLKEISDDRLQGRDHYRVQLWLGSFAAPRILKSGASQSPIAAPGATPLGG